MHHLEYEKMSLEELEHIEKEVRGAIESYYERKLQEAICKMTAVAREMGFASVSEVLDAMPAKGKEGGMLPFYRDPDDYTKVCGRPGRKPKWYHDALARGYTVEQLVIENQIPKMDAKKDR